MKRILAMPLDFCPATWRKGRKKQEGSRSAIVFKLIMKSVGKYTVQGQYVDSSLEACILYKDGVSTVAWRLVHCTRTVC